MIIAKWAYCAGVYNSVLPDYNRLESAPDFATLQESTNILVKGLEDILIRLTKLDFISDQVFVCYS